MPPEQSLTFDHRNTHIAGGGNQAGGRRPGLDHYRTSAVFMSCRQVPSLVPFCTERQTIADTIAPKVP